MIITKGFLRKKKLNVLVVLLLLNQVDDTENIFNEQNIHIVHIVSSLSFMVEMEQLITPHISVHIKRGGRQLLKTEKCEEGLMNMAQAIYSLL